MQAIQVMATKTCTKCKCEKVIEAFGRVRGKPRASCKSCRKAQRDANREKLSASFKAWYATNKEKYNARRKDGYPAKAEKYRANGKAYRKANPEKVKAKNKAYQEANPEKIKAKNKAYYTNNRDRITRRNTASTKRRRQTNPAFRLLDNMRRRVNNALNGKSKSARTLELLGCTVEQARQHLESQFKEGMTWENYGIYGWHVDHIVPCASFDMTKEAEQRKCFHYTNLQPLWAKDNLAKGNKYQEPGVHNLTTPQPVVS